jgi:hypothetical protein
VSDAGEDIAAAVAAYLDDPARGFALAAVFSVPDNPSADLYGETEGLRVIVVPTGETEAKESRSQVFLEPTVSVITMSRIATGFDRVALNGFVKAMRVSLRFVKQATWTWKQTETISKFDSEAIRKGLYVSAFGLTYQGIE